MKKLSLYIFLVLMFCNVGYAEKIYLKDIKINSNITNYFSPKEIDLYNTEIDGKYGFNPSDEARVLGMVQRIFNGEVPHRDFMYQTLVGSAYLHFFHYFIPIYNLQFQRIVVILMFQIYSLALLNLSNNLNFKRIITHFNNAINLLVAKTKLATEITSISH